MTPVFITGTGTGIGKTIVSAIVTNALGAGYWKPVQAGDAGGTDSEMLHELIPAGSVCFPEAYHLAMPASPHIAAKAEQMRIDLDLIFKKYSDIKSNLSSPEFLVIEGAGGILVPLNEKEFVADLILKLDVPVILVSRNYLGSINHSLLTAEVCRMRNIRVLGWIFNDEYMSYQEEIATWSGYPIIGCIPSLQTINRDVIQAQSLLIKNNLLKILEKEVL